MNSDLEKIAEQVRVEADIPEEEKFGSIIAILMIISIVLTVVRVIQECNKDKLKSLSSSQDRYVFCGSKIKLYSVKRGWLSKFRLKKLILKHMSKDQYQKYGSSLQNAIFNTGETLKDDEIVPLVEATNV